MIQVLAKLTGLNPRLSRVQDSKKSMELEMVTFFSPKIRHLKLKLECSVESKLKRTFEQNKLNSKVH